MCTPGQVNSVPGAVPAGLLLLRCLCGKAWLCAEPVPAGPCLWGAAGAFLVSCRCSRCSALILTPKLSPAPPPCCWKPNWGLGIAGGHQLQKGSSARHSGTCWLRQGKNKHFTAGINSLCWQVTKTPSSKSDVCIPMKSTESPGFWLFSTGLPDAGAVSIDVSYLQISPKVPFPRYFSLQAVISHPNCMLIFPAL